MSRFSNMSDSVVEKAKYAMQLFPPESHTIHVILDEDLLNEVKINEEGLDEGTNTEAVKDCSLRKRTKL